MMHREVKNQFGTAIVREGDILTLRQAGAIGIENIIDPHFRVGTVNPERDVIKRIG